MAKRNNNALTRITEAWLERADVAVYAMIAVLFLAAAMAMGIYSVVTFFQHIIDDSRATMWSSCGASVPGGDVLG